MDAYTTLPVGRELITLTNGTEARHLFGRPVLFLTDTTDYLMQIIHWKRYNELHNIPTLHPITNKRIEHPLRVFVLEVNDPIRLRTVNSKRKWSHLGHRLRQSDPDYRMSHTSGDNMQETQSMCHSNRNAGYIETGQFTGSGAIHNNAIGSEIVMCHGLFPKLTLKNIVDPRDVVFGRFQLHQRPIAGIGLLPSDGIGPPPPYVQPVESNRRVPGQATNTSARITAEAPLMIMGFLL